MTASDTTVLIFRNICNFVKDLNESFGERQKSLFLYAALIEKTGLMHEEPIKKHIRLFTEFCRVNENAILSRDRSQLQTSYIQYSDKVKIDLDDIFLMADEEEKQIVWTHLVALLALLCPSSQAKTLLPQTTTSSESSSSSSSNTSSSCTSPSRPREEDFLSNLIDKVGQHIDPTVNNPMEMMNGIMSSGVFQELVSSMNTGLNQGDLDLGRMLNSLQTMIGNMNTMATTTTPSSSV